MFLRLSVLALFALAVSAQVAESEPQPQEVILLVQEPASVPEPLEVLSRENAEALAAQVELAQAELAADAQAKLMSSVDSPLDDSSSSSEEEEEDQTDGDADQEGESTFYKKHGWLALKEKEKYDWKQHTEVKKQAKKAWICIWKPWKC